MDALALYPYTTVARYAFVLESSREVKDLRVFSVFS